MSHAALCWAPSQSQARKRNQNMWPVKKKSLLVDAPITTTDNESTKQPSQLKWVAGYKLNMQKWTRFLNTRNKPDTEILKVSFIMSSNTTHALESSNWNVRASSKEERCTLRMSIHVEDTPWSHADILHITGSQETAALPTTMSCLESVGSSLIDHLYQPSWEEWQTPRRPNSNRKKKKNFTICSKQAWLRKTSNFFGTSSQYRAFSVLWALLSAHRYLAA